MRFLSDDVEREVFRHDQEADLGTIRGVHDEAHNHVIEIVFFDTYDGALLLGQHEDHSVAQLFGSGTGEGLHCLTLFCRGFLSY